MAVSKCPCLTLSNIINGQMPKSHWFLLYASTHSTFNLIGPCNKHPNIQSHKATKIRTPKPLTYELFFQQPAQHGGFVELGARAENPPQSPRGFSALARLHYLARPTKTAMLRRLFFQNSSSRGSSSNNDGDG